MERSDWSVLRAYVINVNIHIYCMYMYVSTLIKDLISSSIDQLALLIRIPVVAIEAGI